MMGDDATVKLYRRLGKKRYLKGKYVYEHERIYVPIPSRFHDRVKPFLNQPLKIKITNKNNGLIIDLHPRENVSARRIDPMKTASKIRFRSFI